jgi:hypothetical protein
MQFDPVISGSSTTLPLHARTANDGVRCGLPVIRPQPGNLESFTKLNECQGDLIGIGAAVAR